MCGTSASAAVIKRDFSLAGRLLTSSRSSTDPAYMEADDIPSEICVVKDNEVENNIPGRLRNMNPSYKDLGGATSRENYVAGVLDFDAVDDNGNALEEEEEAEDAV